MEMRKEWRGIRAVVRCVSWTRDLGRVIPVTAFVDDILVYPPLKSQVPSPQNHHLTQDSLAVQSLWSLIGA